MRQHYLPRFYLQGFIDPDGPRGHTPFVWVYRKAERRWKKRSPKKLGRRTDMYSFASESRDRDDRVEKAIAANEGEMAQLLRNKIEKRAPLSIADRRIAVLFAALMLQRVPALYQELDDHLRTLGPDKAIEWYNSFRGEVEV